MAYNLVKVSGFLLLSCFKSQTGPNPVVHWLFNAKFPSQIQEDDETYFVYSGLEY